MSAPKSGAIIICFDSGEPVFHFFGETDERTASLKKWLEEFDAPSPDPCGDSLHIQEPYSGRPKALKGEPIPPRPAISRMGGKDERNDKTD